MEAIKTTRTFNNGDVQLVTIPNDFRLPDGDLRIEKIGGAVLLIPQNAPWMLFDESLNGFSSDFFADGRNQPDMQQRQTAFDE